jgi:hypothetical protein
LPQIITQQNNRQGEFVQQIETHFGSLRLHLQRQLDSLNRNIRRLQARSSFVAIHPNAPTRRAMGERVEVGVGSDERAELTPREQTSIGVNGVRLHIQGPAGQFVKCQVHLFNISLSIPS